MRDLTKEEEALRERRRERLEQFKAERFPVLADFAKTLDLPNPPLIVNEPDSYLPAIEAFLSNQQIELEDRAWIISRLTYFIGELLIVRMNGGAWFLNEHIGSRTFLRYVVGRFGRAKKAGGMVDPAEVAASVVDSPPPRRLSSLIDEIVQAL